MVLRFMLRIVVRVLFLDLLFRLYYNWKDKGEDDGE